MHFITQKLQFVLFFSSASFMCAPKCCLFAAHSFFAVFLFLLRTKTEEHQRTWRKSKGRNGRPTKRTQIWFMFDFIRDSTWLTGPLVNNNDLGYVGFVCVWGFCCFCWRCCNWISNENVWRKCRLKTLDVLIFLFYLWEKCRVWTAKCRQRACRTVIGAANFPRDKFHWIFIKFMWMCLDRRGHKHTFFLIGCNSAKFVNNWTTQTANRDALSLGTSNIENAGCRCDFFFDFRPDFLFFPVLDFSIWGNIEKYVSRDANAWTIRTSSRTARTQNAHMDKTHAEPKWINGDDKNRTREKKKTNENHCMCCLNLNWMSLPPRATPHDTDSIPYLILRINKILHHIYIYIWVRWIKGKATHQSHFIFNAVPKNHMNK